MRKDTLRTMFVMCIPELSCRRRGDDLRVGGAVDIEVREHEEGIVSQRAAGNGDVIDVVAGEGGPESFFTFEPWLSD